MTRKQIKPAVAAIGAAMVGTLALGSASAAGNPFGIAELDSGYMHLAQAEGKCGGEKSATEGKCGEGKCGGDTAAAASEKAATEGKCGEGKCGGDTPAAASEKAATEGKCGEGKCGEGKCGTAK